MTAREMDNYVTIFDTTLRDGEQSPGASMNLAEKLQIAEVLEEMGVDVIEAGFAIASNGDFEAIREIGKIVKNSSVCSLARSGRLDIDRAWEALQHASRPRIHTFIATSPLHMEVKLQLTPDEVMQSVVGSVGHARNLCEDVEWSAEDATRTEPDFLCAVIEAAIDAGASTINLPDTVGYCVAGEYAAMFDMVRNRVPNIDKATLSTHCHNDLGLAVANSLAGVSAGARQVECTINGLGERAGNAALEEIVMAIKTRADLLNFRTRINTERITRASKLVSTTTGFVVQNNKAIVGANAFAHEAGIHQDGVIKDASTYEIMTPESVGLVKSNLVMGKHSGRAAFRKKLKELGFELNENQFQDAFVRFKNLADKKKQIFDDDISALVDDTTFRGADYVVFVSLKVVCGSEGPQTAELCLAVDGEQKSTTATGDGPVDATFNAIAALFPHTANLQLYQVHAVTEGTDAQAEVTVRLEEDGKTVNGQAADTDTLVASARAYLSALNRLLDKRQRSDPEAMTA